MDLASLRAQQIELASSVCREDRLDKDPPAFIGGADVGFEQGGEVTRAAMVLLKYPSLELVEYKVARIATTMPYIPGFLSFREYPALLAAWEQLSQKPDLLFVDGHGISHPRRLGVASHFGLLVDVPTIGVAKKRLCGKFEPLSTEPGAARWSAYSNHHKSSAPSPAVPWLTGYLPVATYRHCCPSDARRRRRRSSGPKERGRLAR